MKICSVGAKLLHTDGKTDEQTITEPAVTFRNFAKVPCSLRLSRTLHALSTHTTA